MMQEWHLITVHVSIWTCSSIGVIFFISLQLMTCHDFFCRQAVPLPFCEASGQGHHQPVLWGPQQQATLCHHTIQSPAEEYVSKFYVATFSISVISVLSCRCSPSELQGMMGGWNLGGATGHIKAITLLPFPYQRKVHTEGLLGQHALCMLGRTLLVVTLTTLYELWILLLESAS